MSLHSLRLKVITTFFCLAAAGCSSGGDVTASLNQTLTPVVTQAPTIATPSTLTYFSRDSFLIVSGLCNSGYTVRLSEDIVHEQICLNSTYSFTINKLTDGYYPIAVTQFHPEYGSSRQTNLLWIRKTSITPPTVITPGSNPFYSGMETLTVVGGCETGATVTLSGDVSGSTTCQSSSYLITAPKLAVGIFNVKVEQRDPAGNAAHVNFVWERQVLAVNPGAPDLIAGESTVFSPVGGSRSYTTALTVNNSGATYDPVTRTYTAGPVGGVQDTLSVVDSLGLTVLVTINIISGIADHFEIPLDSGNFQITPIGATTSAPIKVKVVDRYGNRVPNFQVTFNVTGGDAEIIGNPVQVTNSQGVAQLHVRMGYGNPRNAIGIKSSNGPLPDLGNSGNEKLTYTLYAETKNTGHVGTLYTVSNTPTQMEIYDFDNDGHQDIAVLNSGDPSIGLLYGKGNGLFRAQTKITGLCSGPSSMTVADFNGDTIMDFAIACSGSDRVSVVLSTGDGAFHPATHINLQTSESLPVAIASGDLNGDGHQDLAIVGAAYTNVSVRYGNGNGTFSANTTFAVGPGPSQVVIADFNNDTKKDIAVLNSGDNSLGLLTNNSMGGFFPHYAIPVGSGPAALVAADFNGDLFMDVAIVNNVDSELMVLTNDQFGGFNVPMTYMTGQSPLSLKAADINGDSILDIMVASLDTNTVSTFIGLVDGSFIPQYDYNTLSGPVFVTAKDVNHDSKADIFVISGGDQKVQSFIGQGDGKLGLESVAGSNPKQTLLADMDNDGFQDLIIVEQGTNSITLLKGNGLGLWTPLNVLTNSAGPSAVIVSDFNNDGHKDMATLHQNISSMRIHIGDGTGHFAPPVVYTTGIQPSALIVKDLNSDGWMDIAVSNSSSNTVSVFANQGDGTFHNKVDFATGSQPLSITAADVNNDQEIDLIVANNAPGSMSVLLSNGSFSFQPHIEFNSGNGSTALVSGFLNGDNNVDIAVLNETDGNVSIFLGNGNGSFQGPTTFFVGNPAYGLAILDYNGNSHADLITTNGGLETATILIGTGNGMFNTVATVHLDQSASLVSIGDYNGDGLVDFVTMNPLLSKYKIWPGN